LIRRSRSALALGLVLALATAGLAFGDGAGDNTAFVDGKVSPSKLDKKKLKPVKLFVEVSTDVTVTGSQENPEKEFIEFGKNIEFDSKAAKFCTAQIAGTTTDQAKSLCPGKSVIGSGDAAVKLNQATTVSDEIVTVFNGPGKNQLRLHAYSPTLQASNTQVIDGALRKANTKGYGTALVVDDAPDAGGDAFAITKFNATISKSSGVAEARCKAKKFQFKRTVTYDDNSSESVTKTQKCKRK
jgi:hypothetical protein